MSEVAQEQEGEVVSAFTNFADLADAAFLTASGQALLCHVQRRIAGALEDAGFRPAAWARGASRNSNRIRVVTEHLAIADPLGGPSLNMVLEFCLMQAGGASRLHFAVSARSTTQIQHLAREELGYESWGTADLMEVEANFRESFHSLVAPGGIDDRVFSDVANKLAFSLAP